MSLFAFTSTSFLVNIYIYTSNNNTVLLTELSSSLDHYINAVTVCNSLARLTSQSSLVKYAQRITLLLKLQQCWTEDHGDVYLVCSSTKHADNKSIIPKCEDDLTDNGFDSNVNDDSSVKSVLDNLNQTSEQHPLEHSNISSGKYEQYRWTNIEHDSEKQSEIKEEEFLNGPCCDTIWEDSASDESPTTKTEVKLTS